MESSCREHFAQLHKLVKKRQLRLLERKLVDDATGRIRAPFRCDLNHAWYLHGEIRFAQRRWLDAVRSYKKAFARDSKDWHALMAIANCYDKAHMPARAASSLRRALAIEPRSAELQYNLGNALFDMGRLHEAIDFYRKAQRESGAVRSLARRNQKRAQAALTQTE